MKRLALVLLVTPLALLAAASAAGWLIPNSHVAASSIVVPAAPHAVWPVIREIGSYPEWWDFAHTAERVPGTEERWVLYGSEGDRLPFTVEHDDTGRSMVTRIDDEGLPFGGSWSYHLEPAGDSTRVTVVEDGVIWNPLLRVAARLIVGYHGTLDSYLSALAKRFGVLRPVVAHVEPPA